ncbi:MAG TPA: YdcF family protein [Anaerolineaceae bacterium]|nr:YdcF family protein [Anaerolineaceae bacterium]
MSIFLSKFLPLFLYPAGLVTLLILLTLVFWKKRRAAFTFLVLAFFILLLAGNKYVATAFARTLEWRYPPLAENTTADVIVVLGGGTEPAIEPRAMVELNAAADRVLYGIKLYQEKAAPMLLLSGGDIDFIGDSPSTPADDMATLMEMLGIPREKMIIQNASLNTQQDAEFSCELIKKNGFKKVILVTSAFHMPRSVALFEKQGCPVIPAPVDFSITQLSWDNLTHPTTAEFILDLLPSYSHISTVTKTLKEYFGIWYYKLSGVL